MFRTSYFSLPVSNLNVFFQAKNIKQAKRGQARVTKVAPSVSVEPLQVQANSKPKIIKDIVKEESKPEELSTSLDTDKPLRLTTIQECGIDNQRIADQRSRLPSESQSSPNKGLQVLHFSPSSRTTFMY